MPAQIQHACDPKTPVIVEHFGNLGYEQGHFSKRLFTLFIVQWNLSIAATHGPEMLGLLERWPDLNWPVYCIVGIGSDKRQLQCEGDCLIQVVA